MGLLQYALDALIAEGCEDIVIRLKNDQQLLGPGRVEKLSLTHPLPGVPGETLPVDGVYRMMANQLVQVSQNSQPMRVTVPITFDANDIQVIMQPPKNPEGDKAIVTPGGKSAGGIVISRS